MTRQELYNKINICGGIDYVTTNYILNNVSVTNESTRLTLVSRISQNGKLSREDLKTLANIVVFRTGSPIDKDTIAGWLTNKKCLTATEWREFLENIDFIDGSQPTYLLAENGQILIEE